MTPPASPVRRAFLVRALGSALLVSSAPILTSGCSALRLNHGDAFNLWRNLPEAGSDDPLDWIHAATLAPSAHNTQPWLFLTHGREYVEIRPDYARNLGALDPFRRELYLSLGCALENLVIAAAHGGYTADVKLQIHPPVLHARFHRDKQRLHDLYPLIPRRHTHRGPYRPDKPVDLELFEPFLKSASTNGIELQLVTRGNGYEQVAAEIASATATMIGDEDVMAASERWMRLSDELVDRYRDGPTLETTGLPPWIIRAAKLLPTPSPENSRGKWLEMTIETQLATAPLFGYFTTARPRDPELLVATGRLWQRLHLTLAGASVAAQPISQVPERIDRELALGAHSPTLTQFQTRFGDENFPLFGFRAGHAEQAALLSPRRALSDVVLRG